MKKLSLLDTDFISKAHSICSGDGASLIDRVMELPDCSFYCHEQTRVELARHDSTAPDWLDDHVQRGMITKYNDERLIREITGLYLGFGKTVYSSYLKNACDAFDRNYYQDHYSKLDTLDQFHISDGEYINTLKELEAKIGEGNNLGEIKAYVVLQWLNTLNDEPVLYFCSDDRGARNGVLSVEGLSARCISIPSVFQRLIAEGVISKDSIKKYMDAAVNYYNEHGQQNLRVIEATPIGRHMRVPCSQVFNEIISDRFVEMKSGMLKYKEDLRSET